MLLKKIIFSTGFLCMVFTPLVFCQYLRKPSLDGDNELKKPFGWKTCDMLGNSPDMILSFSDEIKRYLIILVFLLAYPANAQNYLQNPSVESGSTGAFAPVGWISCHDWSDPDIHEYQEGYFPHDGDRSALMRTRGKYYGGRHPIESAEYMLNKLKYPLTVGSCYEFTVFITNVNAYISSDPVNPETHPVKFELRGTNDSCTTGMEEIETYEFLASTGLITNDGFQQYKLRFTILEQDYRYILIRPFWDTINNSEKYNGIILIDLMNLTKLGETNYPGDTTILIYNDNPPLQLHARQGTSYDWKPKVNLNAYNIQNPYLTAFYDHYSVTSVGNDGCLYFEHFLVSLDCDSIYKKDVEHRYNIYYKHNEEIHLTAGLGKSYQWYPDGLSDSNTRSPIVVNYNDKYTVEVTTVFNCTYKEEFNLIANCDTLFPVQEFVSLDTAVDYNAPVMLVPRFNFIQGNWVPCEGLDNCSAANPMATPQSRTIYSVTMSDEFGCSIVELFNVDINIKIPNVITPLPLSPNYNDEFEIIGLPPGSTLKIFDKMGRLIYHADPYNSEKWWDGKDVNGTNVPAGNYWYVLEKLDSREPYTGFIFVKR